MRASAAVALLLASSASAFGIFATSHRTPINNAIEPVWVNGEMGVYSPSTGQFVPSTSPLYAATCDEIRRNRGYYSGGNYYPHSGWSWFHSYGGGYRSTASSFSSSSSSSFAHSSGSIRGGIGSTGHSFGGSSS